MTRTKLSARKLPDYTFGEELFNTISHTTGAAFGIFALIICVVISARKGDVWGVVGSSIYGASLILLYTASSIYHGLHAGMAKKVMQVIDHCTIYLLIGGTYTPILFCSIRDVSPGWAWTIFGLVWGLALIAASFTAIDHKKYLKLSMACYIGMGWCIIIAAKALISAMEFKGIIWLLAGGISYTIGAVLYGIGKKRKKRYMHSVFHLFVLAGSVMQFICIARYVL